MLKRFISYWFFFSPWFAQGQQELDLYGRSAALVDFATGRTLYAKNADEAIPPASLAKLMSLHLAYRAIEEKRFSRESPMRISEQASWYNQPPRSSLMLLEEGQRVSLQEVMLGLAIPSGNDAAIALAENIGGSVDLFVKRMNAEAARLGMSRTFFADPAGVSKRNRTTALDFARFCRLYIQKHPYALDELHTAAGMAYPQRENWTESGIRWTRMHENHNIIINSYDGADGLKTGYIDESGYNLAATAERGGTRLIAVVLGVEAPGVHSGSLWRMEDAKKLLNYGFDNFKTRFLMQEPQFALQEQAKVWGGVSVAASGSFLEGAAVTLSNQEFSRMQFETHMFELAAPIEKGAVIGQATLRAGGSETVFDIVAAQEAPRLHFLLWLNDKLGLALKRLAAAAFAR